MIEVIRESEETGKYVNYFYGTLSGTRSFMNEDYDEPLTDREILSYETEIEEAIERYNRGDSNLAKYCDVDGGDMKIDSIEIGVKAIGGKLYSCAKITSLEPIEDEELIERLREWLTGQYSDGWGEGFEQHPIDRYEDQYEYEEEYEEEDGTYGTETQYDYQTVEVCIHFWQPDMKPLKFVRGE